jgi:cytochrome P450
LNRFFIDHSLQAALSFLPENIVKGEFLMLEQLSRLQDVPEIYRYLAQMRAEQPVWLDPDSNCWHVYRYEDVNRVITDASLFSSERPRGVAINSANSGRSLIAMDPPDHRQYRNLVSASFTPHALGRLTGRIEEIVQELLDQVRGQGSMDLVSDLAYPLPTIVIAEMLGVPTADRPLFKTWADALFSRQLSDADLFKPENGGESREEVQYMRRTFGEMGNYFQQMLKDREKNPREDMMTELLVAEIDGQRLPVEDVVNFCILLLLAGHITTTNLIQQSVLCFDRFPAVREQLQAQPALMPKAIEEVLRYASPVWRVVRTNKEEVTIADTNIPAGSIIFAWLASANHDASVFAHPNEFDISRSPNRHVGFGHGIHFCIGAPLSRLEAAVALPMLLQQLPGLHIEDREQLELQDSRILFGFKRMPVTFVA